MIELENRQIQLVKAYVSSSQNELTENLRLASFELSTNHFTYQLNSILRASLETENIENLLTELDNAFTNYQTEEEFTVYRVCNYKEMLRYLESDRYFDLGYMSTSTNIENTQAFYQNLSYGYFPALLRINIPIGTNVLLLDNIDNFENNTYESEVLIKRKAIFDVVSNTRIETRDYEDWISRENIEEHQFINYIEMNFNRYAEH